MKFKEFRVFCAKAIDPILFENGFKYIDNGEYLRSDVDGSDVVIIDLDRTGKQFAAIMSYYPRYLEFLEEWAGQKFAERGYLVPSFLTPNVVVRGPKTWPCGITEKLEKSLVQVKFAIEKTGLPWLAKLRDPVFFASHADQVAALFAAVAFEEAGNYAKARELYKLKRLAHEHCLTIGTPKRAERFFTEQSRNGKEFVFVAHKLGLVDSFCEKLMEIHDYRPDFLTLPT